MRSRPPNSGSTAGVGPERLPNPLEPSARQTGTPASSTNEHRCHKDCQPGEHKSLPPRPLGADKSPPDDEPGGSAKPHAQNPGTHSDPAQASAPESFPMALTGLK